MMALKLLHHKRIDFPEQSRKVFLYLFEKKIKHKIR
jgi:hypothetical protein